jgi:hypothetical protein
MFENLACCQTMEDKVARYLQIVDLCILTLEDSSEDKHFMIEKGFAYLINILTLIDSNQVTLEVVDRFMQLFDKFPMDQDWQMACIKNIFFDFEFWAATSFACKEAVILKLSNFISLHADLVKSHIGFSRLIDALYLDYNPEEYRSKLSEYCKHAVIPLTLKRTQSIQWILKELHIIRGLILNILYVALMNIREESIRFEIQALMRYVHFESNDQYKLDALRVLVKLMDPDKGSISKKVMEAINVKGAMSSFYWLILADLTTAKVNVRIRLYAWISICSLLHLTHTVAVKPMVMRSSVATDDSLFDTFSSLGIDDLSSLLKELCGDVIDRAITNLVSISSTVVLELILVFQILMLTFMGKNCQLMIPLIERISEQQTGSLQGITTADLICEALQTAEELIDRTTVIPLLFPVLIQTLQATQLQSEWKLRFLSIIMKCMFEQHATSMNGQLTSNGVLEYLRQKMIVNADLRQDVRYLWLLDKLAATDGTASLQQPTIALTRSEYLGLFKYSTEMSEQYQQHLEMMNNKRNRWKQRIDKESRSADLEAVKIMQQRIDKTVETKRCVIQTWQQLLAELTTERGAWNPGDTIIEDQTKVSLS